MALLDAHDVQRLEAVRRGSEGLARPHQGANDRVAMAARHAELIGELTREGDAEEACASPPSTVTSPHAI